jgi:hypothetical protein
VLHRPSNKGKKVVTAYAPGKLSVRIPIGSNRVGKPCRVQKRTAGFSVLGPRKEGGHAWAQASEYRDGGT